MNYSIPDYPGFTYGSLFCIGRNYVDHIKEMDSVQTTDPVVFLKPRSSIIHNGDTVRIPKQSNDVHHEAELVLLIGKEVKDCDKDEALESVKAFGIGIDFTARDLQSKAKTNGLPWTLAKGFNTFAPLGNFVDYDGSQNIKNLNITLSVNGELKQNDSTSLMIFSPAEIISYLSRQFTLTPGDLIFTGTPKGVSPVSTGDKIRATLGDHLSTIQIDVQ